MTYASKILDSLLNPETKQRILEALKSSGKVEGADMAGTVQLVQKAFGGGSAAVVEMVTEGFQYYLLLTKVVDNSKPFDINEKPKKKRKLTTEEIYSNFILEFPATKNYLDLILKLGAENLVGESLSRGDIEDSLLLLTEEAFADINLTQKEAVQFVAASREGFNPDLIRKVIIAEDIDYCFEGVLFKIKLLADFTKLKLIEILHMDYAAKAKEAEAQLLALVKNIV